nr:PilZ domain-containing protein [uncultured Desulfobulbus sp.]
MDQRKHPRIRMRNMSIDVSDGMGCCSAAVSDISRRGLCLADMAKRFGKKADKFTVVATCGEQHFKFQVKMRWVQLGQWNKRIGVEIETPSSQWTDYVISLEHQRQLF